MRHTKKVTISSHQLVHFTSAFRTTCSWQEPSTVVYTAHYSSHTHTPTMKKKRKQMFWAATGKYGDGIHNKYINNMPPYSSPYLSLHLSPSPSPLYGFVYERVSANCQIIMWFIMYAIRLSFSFFFFPVCLTTARHRYCLTCYRG